MSIKYNITEKLNLEPDIIAGTILVTLYDNRYARIENFKSIIEYSTNIIKFLGTNKRVMIQGSNLQIIQYSAIECNIKGQIIGISYE